MSLRAYAFLGVAIGLEVVATTALKLCEGFTKVGPTIVVVAGYALSFYCLSIVLRTLPTGIAYASWSALGNVLILLIAVKVHGEIPDLPALTGIGLIISGVVILNVFSKMQTH